MKKVRLQQSLHTADFPWNHIWFSGDGPNVFYPLTLSWHMPSMKFTFENPLMKIQKIILKPYISSYFSKFVILYQPAPIAILIILNIYLKEVIKWCVLVWNVMNKQISNTLRIHQCIPNKTISMKISCTVCSVVCKHDV